MSRQTRSRAIAAARKKKKEANKPDYKTRSAWVGSGPTIKDKTLKKQYSYDGGKTWSTSKDRPKRTVKKGMSNIPAKEGKQNNPDFGKESEINKNKLKKKSSKPNLVQTPSPTWGVKKKKEETTAKKETPKETPKKKITARSRMEARNREIHGDDAIDALKKKNKAFQAAKKKKGGMDEFAKKYPKSQTAKKRKLKIATWRDVE